MADDVLACAIDSVTRVPPSTDSKVYVHSGPVAPGTLNANRLPRSAAVTVGFVDHVAFPRRLVPLNLAPTVGPVAPFNQVPAVFSGLNRCIWVTSETRS